MSIEAETFRRMCKAHDLTYMYSDDHAVYRKGSDSLAAIREYAKQLPRSEAVAIWNTAVDESVGVPYRKEFHWKE